MIKRKKGIEMGEIYFYNTFECIWFKHAFGLENYEFWGCGLKSFIFMWQKKLMHNIHDVGVKCNKRMIIIGYMRDSKFRIIDQYHMMTCVTCNAWKRTLPGHPSLLKLCNVTLSMTPFFLTKCPNYHVWNFQW